jgi:putative copper export protein
VTEAGLDVALSVNRLFGYAGFVLIAGTLTFWALVWPQGRADRGLVRLTWAGVGLLALTTVAGPLLRATSYDVSVAEAVGRLSGAAGLVRLAILAVVAGYLNDLSSRDVLGWRRRGFCLAALSGLAATMVLQSNAVGGAWQVAKLVATMGHLVATAAWLGGLVALATVLLPREHLDVLHQLLPRFSLVALGSVVALTVTGVVHALAVAGGIGPLTDSSYGLALALKVGVFALMLLLGNHGRRYAGRLALGHGPSSGGRALAVAIGAELALALGVLAATAVLVLVAPGS